MKMMVISLILLLLMIGIWVWYHFVSIEPVTNFYKESLRDLSDVIEEEQWEKANNDMNLYLDKWKEAKKIWIYFIDQRNVDGIESSMRKINVFIKNKEKADAQAELEHMIILFNTIKENECFTIENIF